MYNCKRPNASNGYVKNIHFTAATYKFLIHVLYLSVKRVCLCFRNDSVLCKVREHHWNTIGRSTREINISSSTGGQTLVFPTVETNLGNAYSGSTGVFTAPASGTYVFSFTVTLYGTPSQRQCPGRTSSR